VRRWSPPVVVVDGALALALTVLDFGSAVDRHGSLRHPAGVILPVVLAQTLPLALRRVGPLAVLAITLASAVVFNLVYADSPTLPVGVVVALYTVAAHCDRRAAVRAGAATAVSLPVAVLVATPAESTGSALPPLILTAAAWMLGDNLRTRRAYLSELEVKAERLERERVEEARRAVARERARIARELHDVISHNVSVMVVQAAAGGDVFDSRPDRARAALASIEAAGREAIGELRRLLGVIRVDEDGTALEPQPGLERLDGLLEQVRAAGLRVELTVEGGRVPLPAGVDLAAYRIVQEALTNTLKHADASQAVVFVRYGASELAVDVLDDGRGPAAANGVDPGGRGLVGIRERVALYGGHVSAGPRAAGGFAVSARFPVGEEPR
jgi:signal transduction histidine kinase